MKYRLPSEQLSLPKTVTMPYSEIVNRQKSDAYTNYCKNFVFLTHTYFYSSTKHRIYSSTVSPESWFWLLGTTAFHQMACNVIVAPYIVLGYIPLEELIKSNYCLLITTPKWRKWKNYYLEVLNFSILNPTVGTMSWVWAFKGKKVEVLWPSWKMQIFKYIWNMNTLQNYFSPSCAIQSLSTNLDPLY